MSYTEVTVGAAKELEVKISGSFEERCQWIRQNLFFDDWQEIYPEDNYVEWQSKDNKFAVEYVRELDKFFLVWFFENNDELDSRVMFKLDWVGLKGFTHFFTFVFYNGGTHFSELFSEYIVKHVEKE